MSETTESTVEKTEKTIEGIVFAFGAYFTTLVAVALPFLLARQFFLRLCRLRERKLLAPPLLFLSISTFLFSIVVGIIDSVEFKNVKTILSGIKTRSNVHISITELLFTILPVFFWVLLVAWAGRLLVTDTERRKELSSYFCYIFGFFGTGFFLWFLTNFLLQLRRLDGFGLFVSSFFFGWVVIQTFALSVVTPWTLTRSEVFLKRILKSAVGLLVLAGMIIGSIFIQAIPRRFNEAIAIPPEPEKEAPIKLTNWPTGIPAEADIRFDGPDHVFIKFRIVAANPRDTTVFLERKMNLGLAKNDPIPLNCLYVDEPDQPSDPLMLAAKQSRLINCQGQLETSQYQAIAGRKVKFEILATWHDPTKGGLHTTTDSIIDDEGGNLYFPQLSEPKPTVEKRKKTP